MKVKTYKEIKDCTREELLEALNETKMDMQFSTGEGLDFLNAKTRYAALIKEAKKRKYK